MFITFRLANSLPDEVLLKLRQDRESDLEKIPANSSMDRDAVELKHFFRYDDWLDRLENSPRWLEKPEVAGIVSERIHALARERYRLLCYCIMPNHVHLLIIPLALENLRHAGKTAKYPVADTLRLLKGSTARYCNEALNRTGPFWQHESYDHYVRDEDELSRTLLYILNNPVKAQLVEDWKDWPFTYVNPELGEW